MNEKNLIASLAVFREFYDKKTDIYNIIASFINDIIIENSLLTFTIVEISELFNQTFEFNIPSSVIKTSLRKLNYLSKSGSSYVVNNSHVLKPEIHDEKIKIENSHNQIFIQLTKFVENASGKTLSENSTKELHHNFCNYLLDESNGDTYLEYISSFIIDNVEDVDFLSKIKVIREGVILHSGIKYTNDTYDFNDFGSWRTELNIFLDTEIIFHFAGYNGTVYQEMASVFLQYVHEINSKSTSKKLIKLLYFPEVKTEIEGFFLKARHILEGKENLNPRITAMVEILQGCSSNSDVLNKKSDLYTSLKTQSINEFTTPIDLTDEKNHEYNIISAEVVAEVNAYLQIDNCEDLLDKFNRISILRKNKNEENFENARFILLSGNSKTLRAAFNTSVYDRFRVPLATNLNFIINRFWFKLNKGFAKKDFPSSFSIITKSQIILSKILSDSIGEKFDELQVKFRKGQLTREQAVNRVNDLRLSAKKPEEIKQEITKEVLDFVTLDSLDDYIDKQNHYKEKVKKLESISTELEEKTRKNNLLEEQLRQSKKTILEEKRGIIDTYNSQLNIAKKHAAEKIKACRVLSFITVIVFYISIVFGIYFFGWDVMEKYTYIIGIPVSLFFIARIILKKQIQIEYLYSKYETKQISKKMRKLSRYSEKEIETLIIETEKLEKEIIEL